MKNEDESPREKTSLFNRLSNRTHSFFVGLMSNLRLSLTLRIAIHYAGQLLKTTLPMLLAAFLALGAAQAPSVNRALDALSRLTWRFPGRAAWACMTTAMDITKRISSKEDL